MKKVSINLFIGKEGYCFDCKSVEDLETVDEVVAILLKNEIKRMKESEVKEK